MTSLFAFQASTQILTRKHVGPFYLPSLGPGSLWDLVPEKCFWAPKTPDPSGWSAQTQDSCVFTKRSAHVDGASGYLTLLLWSYSFLVLPFQSSCHLFLPWKSRVLVRAQFAQQVTLGTGNTIPPCCPSPST